MIKIHDDVCKKYFEEYTEVSRKNVQAFFDKNYGGIQLKQYKEDETTDINLEDFLPHEDVSPAQIIELINEKIKDFDVVRYTDAGGWKNQLRCTNKGINRIESEDKSVKRVMKRLNGYREKNFKEIDEVKQLRKLMKKYPGVTSGS